MAQKTYNILNYGKEYKQAFLELLSDTTTRITLPDEIDGVQYSLGKERWDGDTNLQYIDFNKCDVISTRTCADCSNLTQAIFSTHTTQIGDYAFYNCTKFEDTELPHTLTNIGSHAFDQAGSYYERGTHTFTMIDNIGVHTTIGNHAFYNSHLSEIDAYTNNIGQNAFQACQSLTDVNIEIHGSLGDSAFYNCTYVENFKIDPDSIITSLGNGSFQSLAYSTQAASRNIAPFDFRNSIFTSIGGSIWGSNKYDGVVYFPLKLTTIGGNFLYEATGNWKLYFNLIPTVSSSSYLRNDTTTFTVKYYFPPELLEQAKQATNWSSHTSQMFIWIDGVPAGEEIQPYTKDNGYAITWYSDEAMTQIVTTSAGPSNVYYGEITGSTREVWHVDKKLLDASITISDGPVTYGSFIPVNTTVTITPSYTDPTKNQLFLLKVNGADYTSTGIATLQVTEDLTITAVYWDGEHQPFFPTLADNDWDTIKLVSKLGMVPSSWAVGDTKTLAYDGTTFTARLVDKTGKFTRVADGSMAYLYFELTELLATKEVFNSSNYNSVTSSPLLASMNSGTIWSNLDSDLASVLEEVNVKVSQGGGSNMVINFPAKVFLGREHDLFSTRQFSSTEEWDAIAAQDEYYQTYNTDAARIKIKKGTMYSDEYWSMSPRESVTGSVSSVSGSGSHSTTTASGSRAVALRFAL